MSAAPMPWEEAAQQAPASAPMPWEEAKAAAPNAGLAPPGNSKVKIDFDSPTAGLPGSSPSPQPATEGMTHAAELGIGAAAGVLYGPGILKAAKPYIGPAVASYAISKGRDLPVIGPILKHIPFAEMIPWMVGGKSAAAEPEYPGAPNPEISEELRRGVGLRTGGRAPVDPAAGLGEIPAQSNSPGLFPEGPPVAAPRVTTTPTDPGKLGDLLNEGLGGKIPEGHTEVKGSSLIRSYKYDPATKQFDAALHGDKRNPGGIYVHGEVEPETVAKFEAAKSKGQAWKALKDTPGVTYLGKRMNGELVPAKPPRDLGSATPDDLTPLLQKSLDAARKARTARIAPLQ